MQTQTHNETERKTRGGGGGQKANCCRNCGQYGHIYRDCPRPITSFGIICFRIDPKTKDPEYIMIQRKDSLSFMEFIRGKYDLRNPAYIGQLFSAMTKHERDMLLDTAFEKLWNHVWYQPFMPRHTSEYETAKGKFDSLRAGYTVEGKTIHLKGLLQAYQSPFKDPEWGFPKGRRRLREEDVDCAVREFVEETGLPHEEIKILHHIPPFEEIFFGTNHVLYRHVYYVAQMDYNQDEDVVNVDPSNINQAREVRAIRWFHASEVLEHIRGHNLERKQLFTQAHSRICNQLKG